MDCTIFSVDRGVGRFVAVLVIMVVFIVLPGAFIIHDWGDVYFGKQGAVWWVIFGGIFNLACYEMCRFDN